MFATIGSDGQECNDKGLGKVDQTVSKILVIGASARKFPTNTEISGIFRPLGDFSGLFMIKNRT